MMADLQHSLSNLETTTYTAECRQCDVCLYISDSHNFRHKRLSLSELVPSHEDIGFSPLHRREV